MSNGYHRLARVGTDNGTITIDEGWGSYAEFTFAIDVTGTTGREIALTREQYGELLRQMNEYAMPGTPRWTAKRLDALAEGIAPTGMPVNDDIPF